MSLAGRANKACVKEKKNEVGKKKKGNRADRRTGTKENFPVGRASLRLTPIVFRSAGPPKTNVFTPRIAFEEAKLTRFRK